jgi:branched-chain amino acid transport system permease protein
MQATAASPLKSSPRGIVGVLRAHGFHLAFLAFLLLFPFLVGWLTGSSPFGVLRGDTMQMRGESVRWQSVLIEMFIISVLAMSYNLLFGFTGVISFGHALFFGMGGYILGMMLELTPMDDTLALVLGMLLGMGVSALLGLIIGIATLRLKGVYFAIFTLAVAEMAFIFFRSFQPTRADAGFAITSLPTLIDPTRNRIIFYYIALALFVFTFIFIRRLVSSPTGAVFQAIRENEDRAQAIGFDTLRFKLLSIVVSAMLASAAGMLQVLLNKKVGPEILSLTLYTVNPLLMTIIGGIGTFAGPVIGAVGLHLPHTLFRDQVLQITGRSINVSELWELILGVIFIVVVLVFPQGVVGTIRRWRARRAVSR